MAFRKLYISDNNVFKVVRIPIGAASSLAYKPGMSNIKEYILNLAKHPDYDHIKPVLEGIVKGIEINRPPTKVHCEMQLLNHILDAKNEIVLQEMYNFIGCSKKPCYLCAEAVLGLGASESSSEK
ncbi:hypothetical protein F4818DRAFT_431133 [Hypoxylon cercidicola]|nr:hypothetical protein F4818DRAFT_431133 [Hypoxylon cercidicola]